MIHFLSAIFKKNFNGTPSILAFAGLTLLLLSLGLPSPAAASSFQFSSESILQLFERKNEQGQSQHVIPFYEYMRLDYGNSEEQSLSLHLHGWVRADAGGGDYYEEKTDGELLYGYLAYVSPEETVSATVGRQHAYAGIINDSLDGVGLSARAGPYLSLSAYGGYPVGYQEANGTSGDGMLGARAALHPSWSNEIGFSYKKISDDSTVIENAAGIDVSLSPFQGCSIYGLSSWNLETSDWKEHLYEISIAWDPFYITPFFRYFQYEDFFSGETGAPQPFRFLEGSEEKLTIIGSDLIWRALSSLDLGIRFKHYEYEVQADSSRYAAALVNLYGNGSSASGFEAGVMDGDIEENRYRLLRAFFFWDTPLSFWETWFISADMVYVHYEKEIYGKDRSLFISMGTGKKLAPDNLQIEISGSYSDDPYFDSDYRLLLAVKFDLK